jgi:hypothetical protein
MPCLKRKWILERIGVEMVWGTGGFGGVAILLVRVKERQGGGGVEKAERGCGISAL